MRRQIVGVVPLFHSGVVLGKKDLGRQVSYKSADLGGCSTVLLWDCSGEESFG